LFDDNHNIVRLGWVSWMKRHGCVQDYWGKWKLVDTEKLKPIREQLYKYSTRRLTVDDLPEQFRYNRIFIEPVQFKDARKIRKAYDDLDLTPEILEAYLSEESTEGMENDSEDSIMVQILRARQLAEALKAPDIAEMAQEHMRDGSSVVIFVNFRETLAALCELLDCPFIQGGQKASERQQVIDDFQANKIRCVVVNSAAGGTGISLHDKSGDHPRVSLISPMFSAKILTQVLGRIHRNGMKSDALQYVLVAANSIEEKVMKVVNRKLTNLRTLMY